MNTVKREFALKEGKPVNATGLARQLRWTGSTAASASGNGNSANAALAAGQQAARVRDFVPFRALLN